jgi:hypothetical protein
MTATEIVFIPDGSTVVFKSALTALDPDGSPCEICNNKMADHDWVIMNDDGLVVVGCSIKMEPFHDVALIAYEKTTS